MPIKDEFIENLKNAINVIDVVKEYVELKREKGEMFRGLCPFHDEKTPSFMAKSDHFHCYGCKAHGDAIDFLMKHKGVTFAEAVSLLAERYGMKVEYTDEKSNEKLPHREALKHAERIYQFQLLHTEEGRKAFEYLWNRGFGLEDVQNYGIGLVPSTEVFWKLYNEKHANIKPKEIGILVQRFEGRIAFPIRDMMGRPIGFSCRKWGNMEGEKYINSPETPHFKKGSILYGLDIARVRIAKEQIAILVEGQLDAIRLTKVGLAIGVATLGTAFTNDHATLLKKAGAVRVYIAFDGDKSGQEAIVKAGSILQSHGIEPFVIPLQNGEDVDSYIRDNGEELFRDKLANPMSYVSFLAERYLSVFGNSPNGKSQACESCLKIIEGWSNPIVVRESKRHLAKALGIDSADVVAISQKNGDKKYCGIENALHGEKTALSAILFDSSRAVFLDCLEETDFINNVAKKIFALLKANQDKRAEEIASLLESAGMSAEYAYLHNFSVGVDIRDSKKVVSSLRRQVLMFKLENLQKAFQKHLIQKMDVSDITRDIKIIEQKLSDLSR